MPPGKIAGAASAVLKVADVFRNSRRVVSAVSFFMVRELSGSVARSSWRRQGMVDIQGHTCSGAGNWANRRARAAHEGKTKAARRNPEGRVFENFLCLLLLFFLLLGFLDFALAAALLAFLAVLGRRYAALVRAGFAIGRGFFAAVGLIRKQRAGQERHRTNRNNQTLKRFHVGPF
jgi:hypothetical protein